MVSSTPVAPSRFTARLSPIVPPPLTQDAAVEVIKETVTTAMKAAQVKDPDKDRRNLRDMLAGSGGNGGDDGSSDGSGEDDTHRRDGGHNKDNDQRGRDKGIDGNDSRKRGERKSRSRRKRDGDSKERRRSVPYAGNVPGDTGGGGGSDGSSSSSGSSDRSHNRDAFRGISILRRNRRRAGDLDGNQVSDATVNNFGYGGVGNGSIDLRPLPTKADLILKDFEIPNIMAFMKKFELLNQQFPTPLKMAVYFAETVATRVLNEARRFRKLDRDLDGREILYRGKQLLSNMQLEDVIRSICKPMSSQEMKRILKKSVFDVQKYQFFRQTSVIMKNFQDYRNYLTTYNDQFLARLLLIVDESNIKYLPRTLDGGSGRGEGKEKGLIQYWTQGCPNRKFAYKLWKQGVDEHVRKKCSSFDEFLELYFSVVHKLEMKLRKDYASILHIFDDDADDADPE